MRPSTISPNFTKSMSSRRLCSYETLSIVTEIQSRTLPCGHAVPQLTKVDNACFSGIVRCLQLGYIDNVPTHASCGNKTTITVIFQLLPVDVGSLLFLPSPVDTSSSGTVKCTVQVGSDHSSIVSNLAVKRCTLGPGYSSICDKDIKTAVELMNNLINDCLDTFGIRGVTLIRSA